MKLSVRLLVTAVLLLFASSASAAYAQNGERKSFNISRADTAPVIDGRLDDDVWKHATSIDDFHMTSPTDGATPTESTIVWVTYDDEFLYIAADLRDSNPSEIRAKQMIQGKMFFSDDRFWVTIDSFNTKRNDYFFQVNANGIRREALRENNAQFIEEWSAIWHAESSVHENGWATEIAIPFKSISFAPNSDTWGINFGRGIVRKQEFNLWSSHERQDWPAYGGEVSGINEIEQGLGLDVVPSINLNQGVGHPGRFVRRAAVSVRLSGFRKQLEPEATDVLAGDPSIRRGTRRPTAFSPRRSEPFQCGTSPCASPRRTAFRFLGR